MIFRWTAKPMPGNENFYSLIAIKVSSRDGRAPLDGGSVTEARQDLPEPSLQRGRYDNEY